eukprot:749277-Hanusia_phi.AAC.2
MQHEPPGGRTTASHAGTRKTTTRKMTTKMALMAMVPVLLMSEGAFASSLISKEVSVSGTGVREQIKFSPSFAVLKISLDEDSSIKAEVMSARSTKISDE